MAAPGPALRFDGIGGIRLPSDAAGVTALTDAMAALGTAVDPAGVFTLMAEEYTTARLLAS